MRSSARCRPDSPTWWWRTSSPSSPGGFAAKAVTGDELAVRADVFAHGHDLVRASLRWRPSGTRTWSLTPMQALGNDRFAAGFTPGEIGAYEVEVVGNLDHLATWRRDATRRLDGGRFDPNDPVIGAQLLEEAAEELGPLANGPARRSLRPRGGRARARRGRAQPGGGDRRAGRARPVAGAAAAGRRERRDGAHHGLRPAPARRLLGLVRVLPALDQPDSGPGRHAARPRRPPRLRRRARVRRAVPAADPPDRHHGSQGSRQQPARPARRRRQPVGDRLRARRPRRDRPRARHARGLRQARRRGRRARDRDRPRPRLHDLAGPSLGARAPAVVPPPPRRHDRLRREPAQALPGHLPPRLRDRGSRGPVAGAATR